MRNRRAERGERSPGRGPAPISSPSSPAAACTTVELGPSTGTGSGARSPEPARRGGRRQRPSAAAGGGRRSSTINLLTHRPAVGADDADREPSATAQPGTEPARVAAGMTAATGFVDASPAAGPGHQTPEPARSDAVARAQAEEPPDARAHPEPTRPRPARRRRHALPDPGQALPDPRPTPRAEGPGRQADPGPRSRRTACRRARPGP